MGLRERLRFGGPGAYRGISDWAPNTNYAANTIVANGGLLYRRNTGGNSGASFAADSANWTALGGSTELGQAEITSPSPGTPFINSTAAAGIAIPGLSVTVTTGLRPISVEVDVCIQVLTTSQTIGTLLLYEDGVLIDQRPFNYPAGAQFSGGGVRFSTRRTPAAGSHTYTLQGNTNTATNTWCALGNAASPKSRIAVVQR